MQQLRLLVYLRNRKFSLEKFKKIKNEFIQEEYLYYIDYSIMQVLGMFRTFVSIPEYIDNLILVHKYTCDIWKNGSKHLYFYTLHNQEHAVELIQNSIKIIRAIDYINIAQIDYYVLFVACYLHDISMVTFPELDSIQSDTFESNKIYSDFTTDIFNELKDSKLAQQPVKKMLKDYYIKIDGFYESLVRDSHAKDSAREIRTRKELNFIDKAIREIIAEVSEAHGYSVNEVYKIKSVASSKLWSQKFIKIILRLADLLDMSNYRISTVVLDHNLNNMGAISRFHWLSHLITKGFEIETNYKLDNSKKKSESFLKSQKVIEEIILKIKVEIPQFTKEKSQRCKMMKLYHIDDNILYIKCGEKCTGEKCNFLCKWFSIKNNFLFLELASLKEYLESLPDNYFKPQIKIEVNSSESNRLSPEQFKLLKKYVDDEK